MKVIFFDIDGTLSNFEGRVPESAIKGVRLAQKKGNITALCSGRSENQIDSSIVSIGFDAVVSAAGAYVSVHGEPIFEKYVSSEAYEHCLRVVDGIVPDLCVQTREAVFISEKGYEKLAEFTTAVANASDPADAVGNLVLVPSLEGISKVQKMFYHNASVTVDELSDRLGDYFTVTELSFGEPDPYCGEITINGVVKSTGMQKLMEYYGLTGEDSVAFGDGPNDVDMMQYANIAVCMGNGRNEIKALADYVTADVDEDGVYRGLKHFGLI